MYIYHNKLFWCYQMLSINQKYDGSFHLRYLLRKRQQRSKATYAIQLAYVEIKWFVRFTLCCYAFQKSINQIHAANVWQSVAWLSNYAQGFRSVVLCCGLLPFTFTYLWGLLHWHWSNHKKSIIIDDKTTKKMTRKKMSIFMAYVYTADISYGIFGKHNGNTRWHFDLMEMAWHQQQKSIVTLM